MARRSALDTLFDETVALYLRLSALAATVYGRGEMSGPRRTVLIAIARSSPQTVADLARARAQSRQRLQPLVNALRREGLLALADNPAHKRSPLVRLTPHGRAAVAAIRRIESAGRRRLRVGVSRRGLLDAAAVLREVRRVLERDAPRVVRQRARRRPRS